jgi:hypothetical protein
MATILNSTSRFFVGVDLGQRQDPTAIAALERHSRETGDIDAATRDRVVETQYRVRGLRRVKLGTPYPAVVEEVCGIVRSIAEHGHTTLIVDSTGVGAPVVDLLRASMDSRVLLVPVIFTAGDAARFDNGVYRVPKKDLVHGLMLSFEEGRLRLLDDHPESKALVHELTNMRVKISGESHATYEAWRQGQHDDLVFALALACWRARYTEKRQPLVRSKPLPLW